MEQAVRDKYQTPPPDTAPTEQLLQEAINARFVQFVGMDKISKQQRWRGGNLFKFILLSLFLLLIKSRFNMFLLPKY